MGFLEELKAAYGSSAAPAVEAPAGPSFLEELRGAFSESPEPPKPITSSGRDPGAPSLRPPAPAPSGFEIDTSPGAAEEYFTPDELAGMEGRQVGPPRAATFIESLRTEFAMKDAAEQTRTPSIGEYAADIPLGAAKGLAQQGINLAGQAAGMAETKGRQLAWLSGLSDADLTVETYDKGGNVTGQRLANETDTTPVKLANEASQWLEAKLPTTGAFSEDIGRGLGSLGFFIGGGAVGSALKLPGWMITASLAGGANGLGTHQEILLSGGSDIDAMTGLLVSGGFSTATEVLPMAGILKKLNGGDNALIKLLSKYLTGPSRLGSGLRTAVAEGVQESSEQIVNNVLVDRLSPADVDALDGVVRGGGAGFFTGLFAGLVVGGRSRGMRTRKVIEPVVEGLLGEAGEDAGPVANVPPIEGGPAGEAAAAIPEPDFERISELEQKIEAGKATDEERAEFEATAYEPEQPQATAEQPQATSPTPPGRAPDAPKAGSRSMRKMDDLQEGVRAQLETAAYETGNDPADFLVETPTHMKWAVDFLRKRGVDVAIVRDLPPVETPNGKKRRPRGFYNTPSQTIMLRADLSSADVVLEVATHEVTHHVEAYFNGDYEAARTKLAELDPKGWELAMGVAKKHYPKHRWESERTAIHAQSLRHYLTKAMGNDKTLLKLATGDRTLFEKITDAVVNLARKLGIKADDPLLKRAYRLQKELGLPDTKADPRKLAQGSLVLKNLFNKALSTQTESEVETTPAGKPSKPKAVPASDPSPSKPGEVLGEEGVVPAAAVPKRDRKTVAKERVAAAKAGEEGIANLVRAHGGISSQGKGFDAYRGELERLAEGQDRVPGLSSLVQTKSGGMTPSEALQLAIDNDLLPPFADINDLLAGIESGFNPAEGVRKAKKRKTRLATLGRIIEKGGYDALSEEQREEYIDLAYEGTGEPQFSLAPPEDSDAFKVWFGDDSTNVNNAGRPMVLYHGSPAGAIAEFRPGRGGAAGPGVYLASHSGLAERFAGQSGATYPVYARGRFLRVPYGEVINAKEWNARARKEGYAGLHVLDERVVFDPKDIKSATGNRGTFDTSNPDIRFSLAGDTDSPAFAKWFGDSKVVDAEGKPLVVYHGTSDVFTKFDPDEAMAEYGRSAFFFSDSASVASGYVGRSDSVERAAVRELSEADASLSDLWKKHMKRSELDWYGGGAPYAYQYVERYIEYELEEGTLTKAAAKRVQKAADRLDSAIYAERRVGGPVGGSVVPTYLSIRNPKEMDVSALPDWQLVMPTAIREATEKGHDGAIIKGVRDNADESDEKSTVYVAFEPTQIKSATGNRGTFDASNPDIRFSLAEEESKKAPPFFSALETAVEKITQKRFTAAQLGQATSRTFMTKAKRDKKTGEMRESEEITQTEITGLLGKIPGVTPEEMAYVGWEDMLKGRKSVTKEEVLEYLRANRAEVREVVGGKRHAAGEPFPSGVYAEPREMTGPDLEPVTEYMAVNPAEPDRGMGGWGATPEDAIESARRVWEANEDEETTYSQYQLPGGEAYRELLLTLPERLPADGEGFPTFEEWAEEWLTDEARKDMDWARMNYQKAKEEAGKKARAAVQNTAFRGGHFDEPNVLAHIRFNERTDSEGKRTLFIEEIQSDWHQEGRKKGYGKQAVWDIYRIDEGLPELIGSGPTEAAANAKLGEIAQGLGISTSKLYVRKTEDAKEGVPDAPWKRDWHVLSLKRAIKWAADNGFDQVGWTTGAQQVARYETAYRQAVDSIDWGPWQGGLRRVHIQKGGETVGMLHIDERGITQEGHGGHPQEFLGKPLEDVFGKSIAQQILDEDSGVVQGEGLTIGGKGMEGFYDKMLVSAANKLGKRFGVKAGRAKIGTTNLDPEGAAATGGKWAEFSVWATDERGLSGVEADEAWSERGNPLVAEFMALRHPGSETVHSFPLTDDMRATVKGQGFSTFAAQFSLVDPTDTGIGGGPLDSQRAWDITDVESRGRFMQRKFQDKLSRLNLITEKIEQQLGKVTAETDPRIAATLLPGKTRAALDKFEKQHMDTILEGMAKAGISLEDGGNYLYATHAQKRNDVMGDRHPKKWEDEPGSGMTEEMAEELIAKYEGGENADAYKRLRRQTTRMLKESQAYRKERGLLSDKQVDVMQETFGDSYVPLRTHVEARWDVKAGRGFQIKGREFNRAEGRGSLADNPLIYAFKQHEESIHRAEINDAAQRMGEFFMDNPDPSRWTLRKPKQKVEVNEAGEVVDTGEVLKRDLADYEWAYKVDGQQYIWTIKDPMLAKALLGIGPESLPKMMRYLSSGMRYLAAVNTSFSPEFIVSNLIRDIQTAMIHISGEHSAKLARQTAKAVPKAIQGVYRMERGKGLASKEESAYWQNRAQEFKDAGGMMGWFHAHDFDKAVRSAEKKLKDFNPDKSLPRKGWVALRAVGDLVNDANAAVENGTRLALFDALVKDGVHPRKAASIAKGITVDFNKKGELGTVLNSMYLFMNAGIQGSTRFLYSVAKHPRTRKIMLGVAASGAMMDLLNRMIAGDDDDGENYWDKVPEYVKERNFILMLPGGNRFMFPLPYGHSVFYYAGQNAAAVGAGAKPAWAGAAHMVSSGWNAFNPIASESSDDPVKAILKMASPTMLDPIVQHGINEKWYGAPIKPEQRYGDKPDSQRYWKSTNPHTKDFAAWLNRITGGDTVKGGWADISPAVMDHYMQFFTGSAGRVLTQTTGTAQRILSGEALPAKSVPFLRRFYGEPEDYYVRSKFYDNLEEIEQAPKRNKARKSAGQELLETPWTASWQARGKRLRAQVKAKRDKAQVETDKARKLKLEKEALQLQKEFNKKVLEARKP